MTPTGYRDMQYQDSVLDDEENTTADVSVNSDIKTKFYFYITSLVIVMTVLMTVHVIAFVIIYLYDHFYEKYFFVLLGQLNLINRLLPMKLLNLLLDRFCGTKEQFTPERSSSHYGHH